MNRIYNYFEKAYKCDKIGHAFLIGNISFLECKEELEKAINDFIFKNSVSLVDNPDVTIVEPITNSITKEQIRNLLSEISTTSQVSGKKVYIITNCENLSDTVYNALLKTIEEPGDNLYAFLITSNIEAVGDTIKSRCQVVFTSSYQQDARDEKVFGLACECVQNIEKNGLNCIAENANIYTKIENKNSLKLVLKEMFNIYINALYNNVGINCENSNIVIKCSTGCLCKKVLAVNNLIEKNNININKDIALDKLMIDLWRCNL